MALGALSLAKRRGLKVPKDLSIIGFDNISLSEFCDPPLTTVSQPRFDIGRKNAAITDQMQGQTVNSGSRLLDCELIVRGSTQKNDDNVNVFRAADWSKARRLSNMAG